MKKTTRPCSPSPCDFVWRIAIALAVTFTTFALASSASAATFNPNLVISDSNMRAYYSMSAAQIHAFLSTKNGPLNSDPSFARHGGGASAPASVLIEEACTQFGISPRVLITMLQKEQGLIDTVDNGHPLSYRFDWACGMGVPDNGTYNLAKQGFGNQVWWCALRLDGYGEKKPNVTDIPRWLGPGDTTGMPSGVAPVNISTWKLYIYNPHVSGNKLFYDVYVRHFGDPTTGFSFTPITGPAGSVFRFYNAKLGSHFYTASVDEANNVQDRLWATLRYEGPAYVADQSKNSLPLYRFFNKKNGSHFYTTSITERDYVYSKLSATYSYDGPAYNVSTAGTAGGTAVYRFFNKKNGTHFYTASLAERDNVVAKLGYVYNYEGVAFSVITP